MVVFAVVLIAAACTSSLVEQDLPTAVFDHPPSFGVRYAFDHSPVLTLERSVLSPLARTFATEFGNVQRAKGLLAHQLAGFHRDDASTTVSVERPSENTIPLPRTRPLQADLSAGRARASGGSDVSLLQKIADLFGGVTRLASLSPNADLSESLTVTPLGLEDHTALYDISAHAIYMPGGSKLEAHSGLGTFRDSPEHVSERDVGATPPAIYDLRPREQLFHGVQALRMVPVGGQRPLGRDGLLTHGYMLGPDGDSNGCVSIREYDKFLTAFKNGEVKRLVVVTSSSTAAQMAQIRS